ncbi:major facilitator transporter [Actinoplanes friuliensis DSM 7358]|uniref:Major facilitator transporter n=1 Tax=Actinoplanes friuliensis DSM 7358 TaxID=1246995 RepID=U5VTP7_9ACTN|nr:major facilitator transporter [Actinoplanes friuliensis DSM 7358]
MLCVMALMIVLDSTIVAVAVPAIQADLGFSPAGVAWVVNGYLIGFAGLLLLAGRLGDLVGARRVFLAGLVVFTAASLLCGLATTAPLLVAGRFVQGVGGALASAVIFSLIVRLYPEPGAQARAIGVYSFTQAGGAAFGFVAGGLLTEAAGWPWIFLVNVPIGVVVLVAALRVVPRETGLGLGAGLDVSGATLITAGLSLGVYAIVDGGPWYGLAAFLLVTAFLIRERYARSPLAPLPVLRRRRLLGTGAAVVLIFATGMGFQFVNALFLQRVAGLDAIGTGLAFVPTPLVIGVMSLIVAPRVTARFGARPVLLAGLGVLAAGLLLLVPVPADPSYATDILPALLIMGLGIGVVIPAIIMLAMSNAAPQETGLVSGLTNTAQQAGAALGLAVLAVIAARVTESSLASGVSEVAALRDGYSRAYLTAAGFAAAAFVIAALALRRPATIPTDDPAVTPAPPTSAAATDPAVTPAPPADAAAAERQTCALVADQP